MYFSGICHGRRRRLNNFWSWPDPHPIAPRDKISRKGKPLAPILTSLCLKGLISTHPNKSERCLPSCLAGKNDMWLSSVRKAACFVVCHWKFAFWIAVHRSEGFPLAAYLVPGRDGMGVWPNSEIVRRAAAASSMTNTWKIHKSSKHKNLTIGP